MNTNSSNTGTNNSNAAATSSTPSTGSTPCSSTPSSEKANWEFTPETPSPEPSSSPSIGVVHGSPESSASTSSSDGSSSSRLSFSYTGLTYGQALEAMKQGVKVCRSSWTGSAYCWIKPASVIEETWVKDPYLKEAITAFGFETPISGSAEEGTCLGIVGLSTICLKSSDNHIVTGWCPSTTDMLSDDWCICEITE